MPGDAGAAGTPLLGSSACCHASSAPQQPGCRISFWADRPVLKCHLAKGSGHKRERVGGSAEIWVSLVTVTS